MTVLTFLAAFVVVIVGLVALGLLTLAIEALFDAMPEWLHFVLALAMVTGLTVGLAAAWQGKIDLTRFEKVAS